MINGMTAGVYYILTIGLLIMSLIISARVKSLFRKYSSVSAPFTGRQAAERILRANGIYDVAITGVGGTLTDNYSPMNKTLNLSENVIDTASVAAVAIAAHESGHAIQHAEGYFPLKIRKTLVPAANICSRFSYIFVLLGLFFQQFSVLIDIGVIMFAVVVFVHLVTMPVELNASRRALANMESLGLVSSDSEGIARKLLNAAALTYFVALASVLVQFLRLLSLARRRN
ncbi:MAG: zinc metallopeptidase [Oscillospiraceae bacterium]|nr:zinc metallopeptidase [Oscillospiraceae bacterium]